MKYKYRFLSNLGHDDFFKIRNYDLASCQIINVIQKQQPIREYRLMDVHILVNDMTIKR